MSWRTIVRWRPCIPNVSKAPPYLFRSAHGVSRVHTQVHANTDALRKKKKKKGVLFSLKGRDLETAAVNGRKTMKRFSSPSEEALPGSRSMMLCGSWEGMGGGGMCICGAVIEYVQLVL